MRVKYLKIARENNNFSTLCDLIQTPIWFKDKDLKFTWVNEFYSMMFDREREELYGLTDIDIAPKKLVDGYVRDDEYVLESRKVYKYKENEKAGLWYETTKFPLIDRKNQLYGIGGVAFNITAIKKSEKMLHDLVHNDYLTGISNRLFPLIDRKNQLYGIGGVAFNITAIKKSEKMLHDLVHNDYLTGISNRLFLSV